MHVYAHSPARPAELNVVPIYTGLQIEVNVFNGKSVSMTFMICSQPSGLALLADETPLYDQYLAMILISDLNTTVFQ